MKASPARYFFRKKQPTPQRERSDACVLCSTVCLLRGRWKAWGLFSLTSCCWQTVLFRLVVFPTCYGGLSVCQEALNLVLAYWSCVPLCTFAIKLKKKNEINVLEFLRPEITMYLHYVPSFPVNACDAVCWVTAVLVRSLKSVLYCF